MAYSLKMVGKHTILSLFRIFSALSIWENRPEWVYIIPIANNLTYVSGILKWNVMQSIYWIFLALGWSPKPKQSWRTNSKNQQAFFCGIADLSKREIPTNISLSTAINQLQFKKPSIVVLWRTMELPFWILYSTTSNCFRPNVLLDKWQSIKLWERLERLRAYIAHTFSPEGMQKRDISRS